jgi:hypothetical protein
MESIKKTTIIALLFIVIAIIPEQIFSEKDKSLSFSVLTHGKRGDFYQVYVKLQNLTSEKLEVPLSPTIVDKNGKEYATEPVSTANPNIFIPAGVAITVKDGYLNNIIIPSKDEKPSPLVFKFSFEVPQECKPIRIKLAPEGPTSDVSKTAELPLIKSPEIETNFQQEGVSLSIKKVARALETLKEGEVPELTGLPKALQAIDPKYGAEFTLNIQKDFTIASSDVWLLILASFKNNSKTELNIPISKIIAVPEIKIGDRESCELVGIAKNGQVNLGIPSDEQITIAAAKSANIILIYRTEYWELWIDKFTLE